MCLNAEDKAKIEVGSSLVNSRIASGKRIRIASGTRVRTGSGTRRTILKQSWTSAGPYLPQIRFADPIQFRADVRLDNGPSLFGGSGPDRLLGAAQIRPSVSLLSGQLCIGVE
ncbi:hypothetical protein NQZ68_014152 [Dissostichus eleginoides]|nr:hypothetical protein NQZ68_014152 [Dissostichus eleginoides]